MSLNTINMAPTLPEADILDAFHDVEYKTQETIRDFAELVHTAYHRGRRAEKICCMVQYIYHENKTYEDAEKLFAGPLLQWKNLREDVEKYLRYYAANQE